MAQEKDAVHLDPQEIEALFMESELLFELIIRDGGHGEQEQRGCLQWDGQQWCEVFPGHSLYIGSPRGTFLSIFLLA